MDVTVVVQNVGGWAGDEVAQLSVAVPISHSGAGGNAPIRQLEGFQRFHLTPGETQQITFHLTRDQLSAVTETGERVFKPGKFALWVGGGQPGYTSAGTSGIIDLSGV